MIGNPFETTLALHYLIFDGVLERHPNLKMLAVHGGGYLGAYSGRIDHAWGARSDCQGDLPHPPTHYLKKIYGARGYYCRVGTDLRGAWRLVVFRKLTRRSLLRII